MCSEVLLKILKIPETKKPSGLLQTGWYKAIKPTYPHLYN